MKKDHILIAIISLLSVGIIGAFIGILFQKRTIENISERAEDRDFENPQHYFPMHGISFDKSDATILKRDAIKYDLTIDYDFDLEGKLHAYFEVYSYNYEYFDKLDSKSITSQGDIHWSEAKNTMPPYESVDYTTNKIRINFYKPIPKYNFQNDDYYYDEVKYFIIAPEYIHYNGCILNNHIFGEAGVTNLNSINLNKDTIISNVFVTPLAYKYIESPKNSNDGCLVLLCMRNSHNIWQNIIFCGDEKTRNTIINRPELIITKNPF